MKPRPRSHLARVGTLALGGLAAIASQHAHAGGIPEPDLVWYGKVLNRVNGQTVRLTSGSLTWNITDATGQSVLILNLSLTNLHDQFSYVARVSCETPLEGFESDPSRLPILASPKTYDRSQVRLGDQSLTLSGGPVQFTLSPSYRGRLERIDLYLGAVPTDSDGDGLPDDWEDQHFPGGGAQPGDDPDGDGISNWDEYLAGTDPNDPNSLFQILTVEPAAIGFRITWSSMPGKSYRVLGSSQLLSDPGTFQLLQSGLTATPPLNQYLDPTASNSGIRFYRVQVEP